MDPPSDGRADDQSQGAGSPEERARRGALLSAFFSAATDPWLFWDADGCIADANRAFLTFVDVSLKDVLGTTGDTWIRTMPMATPLAQILEELTHVERSIPGWRGAVTVHSGSVSVPGHLVLAACEPDGFSAAVVIGQVIIAERDPGSTSDARQVADRLATVGLLAGSAAHEIKNDLAPLLGYLSLLEASDTEGMVAPMRESVRRIHEHVEQILEPLRPRVRARGPVVLSVAIEATIDRLKRAGRLRRLNLEVEVDDEIVVLADKAEVGQFLVNLLINALDALGDGAGALRGTIALKVEARDGFAQLEIRDSGTGVPAELSARAFEAFTTSKDQRGTGLGLPVVLDIVRDLGGRLSMVSEAGRGTTVRVELPLYASSGART